MQAMYLAPTGLQISSLYDSYPKLKLYWTSHWRISFIVADMLATHRVREFPFVKN